MQQQSTSSGIGPTAVLFTFMLAHFGHHLAAAAVIPLLPMIRDSFGLDYARSGLLVSAFTLTMGVAQLPAAAFADRVSKRLIISIGLLGTGVACVAVSLSADYPQLLLSLVLMGLAGSTYHAPAAAFLSQVFGKAERGRSLGMHVVGGSSGLMAAPLVAILIANTTGSWRNSFLVMGVPVVLAGVLVWSLSGAREAANAAEATKRASRPMGIWQGMRLLGMVVALALISMLLVSGMNSFLPLYLVDKHGMSSDVAGLMMGIVYGAGLVGAPVGGALSDRLGRKPVILFSVAAVGPFFYLVTVTPTGLLMAPVIAVYGAIAIFRLPSMESLIADVIPAQRRATFLGGYYFLAQEASGLFTPVLGWMIDQFGLDSGFSFLAAAGMGFSVLVLLLWRRI